MATIATTPIPAPEIDYRAPQGWAAQEDAYMAVLVNAAKGAAGRNADSRIGRTVQFPVADGYAVYVIAKVRPLTLWHVNTGDGYAALGSTIRGFGLADVDAQLSYADALTGLRNEHDDFFAALPLGSIVHYDNGFAQFVRCVRIAGERGKRLRPIALVGNWDTYDLVTRNVDGTVRYGYHAEKIASGTDAFEPNVSNIWEAKDAKGRAWSMRGLSNTSGLNEVGLARFAEKRYQAPFDPTVEPAIDLSVPDPTPYEEMLADYANVLNDVRALVESDPERSTDAYRALFDRVSAAVEHHTS